MDLKDYVGDLKLLLKQLQKVGKILSMSETYSKPCQISKMEQFCLNN